MMLRVPLLAGLAAAATLGDLPVHCTSREVAGDWTFIVSAPVPERPACGHQRPDDTAREPRGLSGDATRVTLAPGEGGGEAVGQTRGQWTLVADEAVEVVVDGRSFLALFDFAPLAAETDERLSAEATQLHSRCSRTLVGWYASQDRSTFGCWRGEKVTAAREPALFLQRSARAVRREAGSDVDWRHVNGQSFVDAPVLQGQCGSCYAIASTAMLSARHRVRQGDPALPGFSVNAPLFCSEYTQGCARGFPYLSAKWSADVGLVQGPAYDPHSSCAEALQGLDSGQRWRASNYRYVEASELRSALDDGPVAVSFVADGLRDYQGGDFKPPQRAQAASRAEAAALVTHSGLLVGLADGRWVVQSSWGEAWGEQGSFRVRVEDADDMLLTALAVAADVEPEDRPEVLAQTAAATSLALLQTATAAGQEPATAAGQEPATAAGQEPATAAGQDPVPAPPAPDYSCSDGEAIVTFSGSKRSLRFQGSTGTETAVYCNELAGSCGLSGEGSCPDQACPCTFPSDRPLAFAGMNAIADKAVLMCAALGRLDLLVVGLGGGAIPTYIQEQCSQKGAKVHIESIELSPTVASLAQRFFGYTSETGSVDLTDGLQGLEARQGRTFDLVVVDCFGDGDEVPGSCRSGEFVASAAHVLPADGLVVQNVWTRSSAAKQGVDLSAEYDALKREYQGRFGAVKEETVVDAAQSREQLLYGVKGSKWTALFED